jgi:long-chain acyl-CoA synthetase
VATQEAVAVNALPPGCTTISRLFRHAVSVRSERAALMRKVLGIWQAVSWREYGEQARATGLGLAALGLAPGDRAAVLAATVPEWLYADMGILGVGAVAVGICESCSAEQVEYVVNDSGARYLLVGDEEQLDKALERRDRMGGLERLIVFDAKGLERLHDPGVMRYDDLLELGRAAEQKEAGRWERLGPTARSSSTPRAPRVLPRARS